MRCSLQVQRIQHGAGYSARCPSSTCWEISVQILQFQTCNKKKFWDFVNEDFLLIWSLINCMNWLTLRRQSCCLGQQLSKLYQVRNKLQWLLRTHPRMHAHSRLSMFVINCYQTSIFNVNYFIPSTYKISAVNIQSNIKKQEKIK
jgi:hypothetical protein